MMGDKDLIKCKKTDAEEQIGYWLYPELKKQKKKFEFRQDQWENIRKIINCYNARISGKNSSDAFVLMRTGGGKTLCYQYPALCFAGCGNYSTKKGITIIIEPLISLIYDQVNEFNDKMKRAKQPYRAVAYRSDNDGSTLKKRRGILNGKYQLIYTSPESISYILNKSFFKELKNCGITVSMIVVDECHCISQWGYDFRKEYLEIPGFINIIRQENHLPVIAAFTATASVSICDDVCRNLRIHMNNKQDLTNKNAQENPFKKDNLLLDIRKIPDRETNNRQVRSYIEKNKEKKGVVFCATIKNLTSLGKHLDKYDIKYTIYHGKLKNEEKNENLEAFRQAKGSYVMLATKAFSMGVDIKDVDYVLHRDMPESIEEYYQEVGRAGRDSIKYTKENKAKAVLFFSERDIEHFGERYGQSEEECLSDIEKIAKQIGESRANSLKKLLTDAVDKKLKNEKMSDFIYDEIRAYMDEPIGEYEKFRSEKKYRDQLKLLETSLSEMCINTTLIAHAIRKGGCEYNTNYSTHYHGKKKGTQNDTVEFKLISDTEKENINFFDMMVADAVYTTGQYSRDNMITVNDILRCMTGDPKARLYHTSKVKEKDIGLLVQESIRKLCDIKIEIKHTGEALKDKLGRKSKKIFKGSFLKLEKCEVNSSKSEKQDESTTYKYCKSPLYEYAEYCNSRFMSIPHKMLAAGKFPNSFLNTKIKFFISFRISINKATSQKEIFRDGEKEVVKGKYRNGVIRIFGEDLHKDKKRYLNDVLGNGKMTLYDESGKINVKYRKLIQQRIEDVLSEITSACGNITWEKIYYRKDEKKYKRVPKLERNEKKAILRDDVVQDLILGGYEIYIDFK